MSEEIKDEEIKVSEEKDGSATVEVPESLLPADNEDDQKADGGQADGDEDHPDDTDAVREARRARRRAKKEYVKRVQTEKDERLAAQDRELQALRERMAQMERRSQVADMARIDKAISDEESRMNYAKVKMKEATDQSDGQALVRAQELYHETRDRIEKLKGYKNHVEGQAKPEEEASPVIKRQAERWMEKNSWYDPEGVDSKSRLAKKIDAQLAKEGWNPATRDYWEELDSRLQDEEEGAYTGNTSETPRRRGPKNVVTGSERETGGGASRNTFTLTPEQVRAMKEAGFWDDPKKRSRMIQKYAEQARQNRS